MTPTVHSPRRAPASTVFKPAVFLPMHGVFFTKDQQTYVKLASI